MLQAILWHINNWFERESSRGDFTISGGELVNPGVSIADGQYFRIQGSVFNDGLHLFPCELADEEFTGKVSALAIPQAVKDIAEEAEAWERENGSASASTLQSESFGGYSYTRASAYDSASGSSCPMTWKSVFGPRLRQWKRL